MRIKELSTLAGAVILSATAFLILEHEVPRETPEVTDSRPDFEDASSLVEYSPPVPTAEPPAAPAQSAPDAIPASPEAASPNSAEPGKTAGGIAPDPANAVAESVEVAANPDSTSPGTTGEGLSESFRKSVAAANADTPKGSEASTASGDSPEEQPSIIEETADGFWLKSAKLNDVFQHLAELGDYQYFHNTEIEGPTFVVTGQLMNDDPVKQMEEIALTSSQLSQLPSEPFRYQLKYLRPKDIEQIKLILQPFLTPGSGIIEYETKTNTLIVMDNSRKLDALAIFLDQIDQPKQQIAIETRILRVTSDSKNQIGVDWSSVLGDNGLSLNSVTSLNALFNLPDLATAAEFISSADDGNTFTTSNVTAAGEFRAAGDEGGSGSTVLSPIQLTAVLRALEAGGLADQESSPTLIAEDNEEGLISIIDRIPIVTSTVTINNGSQNITEEVRYKIDEEDLAGDPTTTREVGVSVAVTPTILPDNTIRMALRPRSAQVTEYITTPSGNQFPRVNESSVTTTARVPNGHSLLIGGFYEESSQDVTKKVPILGDVPAVNLLFKSTTTEKKNTSLVFIITPKLYRPELAVENDAMSHEIHESHVLPSNHDYPNRFKPGANYRSNLKNSLKNTFSQYEPDPPSNLLHPEHPYNRPESLPTHDYPRNFDEPRFASDGNSPEVTVRPVGENGRNTGFLGKILGGNKKAKFP